MAEPFPGKVLVVDDDPTSLRVMANLLLREQYQVSTATDGEEAFSMALLEPPDAIVLDVHMPGGDGYDACRRLKREAELREVPVLFLSGLADPFNRASAFEAGAVDYVLKPCDPADLIARVGVHVRVRQLLRQVARRNEDLARERQRQDDLFTMLAHDVRSPLTAIIGSLDLLHTSDPPLPECATELISDAASGAQRVNELVSDLLSVRALETGEHTPVLEPAGADTILVHALRSLGDEACARIDAHCDAGQIRCDSSLLARALANLLRTALRCVPGEQRILLTWSEPRSGVSRIVVSGPEAMSPASVAPDSDLNRGVDATSSATNLGLTFSRLVSEAHGGRLNVSSQASDGPIFSLQLPIEGPAQNRPAGDCP